MRLVFAGTPEFAARALEALAAAGHEIALVLTQPDRPAGRGLRLAPSAVKRVALALGLPLHQPASLRDPAQAEPIAQARPDVLIVAAYGLILPPPVLAMAPHGAINIHASLLPRWRGAAPIQRALLAGDRESGITIMQMDEGLDTGPMLAVHRMAVAAEDDAQSLHDKLAELGARAIVEALAALVAERLHATPQPAAGATYARKIGKEDLDVDWRKNCEDIERQVRALRPAPGARSTLRDEPVKLWRASAEPGNGAAGEVLAADARGIVVACGAGALRIAELQRAGGTRLGAADFLRGFPLRAGDRFGAAR